MSLTDTTPRAAARIAGLGYATIFLLAIFANFAVKMRLVVPDDPAATVANLAGSAGLVRAGIAAFAVVFLLDIAIAWALYVLLRPTSPRRSLHAAWFRLAYTVFLGVGAMFLYLALRLATESSYLDALGAQAHGSAVMLALEAFDYTWLVGLAAFGVHLVLVGRLLVSSGAAPRPLGWVLMVAGAAYVVDTFAHTLLVDYASYANVFLAMVAIPSIVGELAFTVWLLARGGRTTGAESTPGLARHASVTA